MRGAAEEDDLFRHRNDGPKRRRCISKQSASCHGEFESKWSGHRICPACKEYQRKANLSEGPEFTDEQLHEEEFQSVLSIDNK